MVVTSIKGMPCSVHCAGGDVLVTHNDFVHPLRDLPKDRAVARVHKDTVTSVCLSSPSPDVRVTSLLCKQEEQRILVNETEM